MISKRWITLGLSLLGVLGVGGTAYTAVKCSKKADEVEDKKEKVKAYAPAIIVGVGTSAAILGSHYISRKEIVALTATCAYLTKNRDKIEAKIREKFGEEKLSEVRKEVAKETTEESDLKVNDTPWDWVDWKGNRVTVEDTGRGKDRFFDWYSGRFFLSSYEDVLRGLKRLNHDFHMGNYVCMNDLYGYWGIQSTQLGGTFGWPANDDYCDYNLEEPIPYEIIHIDPGTDNEVYIIELRGTPPMECWMEV